ncbi:MAG TPA: gamma-glutamylcyclotransferase [Acidimicrobiia bacterium]|jgi:hypothetical protein
MAEVAPGATFEFIAHLPEWGIDFPIRDAQWGGGLPTVRAGMGSTVWGAVFSVPDREFGVLDRVEATEQRVCETVEAMDRNGKRHKVRVHLHAETGEHYSPSVDYLKLMLEGSKHWGLPFGWVAGLEEHLQNGS